MKYIFSLIFLFSFITWSCKNNSTSSNGDPQKLLIGVFSGDNPIQTKTNIGFYQKYLEKELGMEVEFFFSTDYTTLIEGMQRKKLHVAQLQPFAYVIATQKPGIIPLVTFGFQNNPSFYHSIIFTSSSSDIKSLEEVKQKSKQLTLCFGDPASASGHLIPRSYLKSLGLEPDNAFKQTLFSGSHAATIMSVRSGKVDIGCSTSDLALDKLIREGTVKKEEFRILWTSEPIINDVITARSDLSPALIQKIKKAYLDANTKDPKAFAASIYRYYPNPEGMQFISIEDSAYNSIRKIAAGIKELKLVN